MFVWVRVTRVGTRVMTRMYDLVSSSMVDRPLSVSLTFGQLWGIVRI